jgi:hypothetical protein
MVPHLLSLFASVASASTWPLFASVASASTWPDSSNGVHLFLTFDSSVKPNEISENPNATQLDFVWGANPHHIQAYRNSSNPDTVLSRYIPCCRDGSARYLKGLAEYKAKGWGDRVLYTCDRKTPAWTTYPGEPFSETALIPLDISNPDVIDWQIETYAKPSIEQGYDAIAWDNFDLNNQFRACGVWRKNGTEWVQKFANSSRDPAYAAAAVAWLGATKRRVNALTTKRGRKMVIIPNYSLSGNWNDSTVLAVGNATDGVLSESGWTGGGARQGRAYDYVGEAWVQRVRWMRNLQAHGVGVYFINEFGDISHPKKWKEPCEQDPLNCITRPVRQWVLASYLIGKEQAAGIYLSGIQAYGNWSYYPEWSAPIGSALGPPVEESSGLWWRDYSAGPPAASTTTTSTSSPRRGHADSRGGSSTAATGQRVLGARVLVNPSPTNKVTATLPAGSWVSLYGEPQPAGALELPPVTAATLLRTG